MLYAYSAVITNFHAADLNDHDQVVGVSSSLPAIWENGTVRLLPTEGFKNCRAVAINNRGEIVGWGEDAQGEFHALWWRDSVLIDLGPGMALDLNDAGEIVGCCDTRAFWGLAWMYEIPEPVRPFTPLSIPNRPPTYAARWRNGELTWRGPEHSQLRAVNSSGVAAGAAGTVPIRCSSAGEIVSLAIPAPYPRAVGNAISEEGVVGGTAMYESYGDEIDDEEEYDRFGSAVLWEDREAQVLARYREGNGTGFMSFDRSGLALYNADCSDGYVPTTSVGAILLRGSRSRSVESLTPSNAPMDFEVPWPHVGNRAWGMILGVAINNCGTILLQQDHQAVILKDSPETRAKELRRLKEYESRLNEALPGHCLAPDVISRHLGLDMEAPKESR